MRIVGSITTAFFLLIVAAIGFIYLAPERAVTTFIGVERWRAGLERKEISLSDGTHYVYLEGGDGEPLMLLHGFGGNKDNFVRTARFLTSKYRLIIPDHMGFGESSHPADADYSPNAQAERVHTLAKLLGFTKLDLGGSSMGGQIALSYAVLYPNEVRSLWLIDTAGVWSAPESEVRKIIRETGKNPLLARNEEEFAALFPLVMKKAPFIPRPMMNILARERIGNFDLEQKIFSQIAADSIEDRVRGLATPTLIVWGDKDRTINVATAEMLHNLMPNSKVVIMPDIGHLPMVEDPQQSAEDYLQFRAKL